VEYFIYFGSLITKDAKFTREIKSMTNIIIQQEEDSFHQQIRLKFKEETSTVLHLEHSFL
jgi:hypothetical protein